MLAALFIMIAVGSIVSVIMCMDSDGDEIKYEKLEPSADATE